MPYPYGYTVGQCSRKGNFSPLLLHQHKTMASSSQLIEKRFTSSPTFAITPPRRAHQTLLSTRFLAMNSYYQSQNNAALAAQMQDSSLAADLQADNQVDAWGYYIGSSPVGLNGTPAELASMDLN